jgi:hypothetical protein
MKKVILSLAVLFSTLSYSQLKQTKLTDEEVNILADSKKGLGVFNYNEIKKYNLQNILAYVAEFQYEEKVIGTAIVNVLYNIGAGFSSFSLSFPTISICFKTSDLPNDVQLALLKEGNWKIDKDGGQQEYLCPNGLGIGLFHTEDYDTYTLRKLADGKIKLVLYKLEKQQ